VINNPIAYVQFSFPLKFQNQKLSADTDSATGTKVEGRIYQFFHAREKVNLIGFPSKSRN
jgi:hypothetical protein